MEAAVLRSCFDKTDKNTIAKALKFEERGIRGKGRPKCTWKKQAYDIFKNGLMKNDECKRTK